MTAHSGRLLAFLAEPADPPANPQSNRFSEEREGEITADTEGETNAEREGETDAEREGKTDAERERREEREILMKTLVNMGATEKQAKLELVYWGFSSTLSEEERRTLVNRVG